MVWIVLSCLTVTFLCLYISASDSKSSTAANRGRQESSEESADSLFYSETGYHPFAHFQLNSDYRGVQRTQASSQGMVASDHGECSDMGGEILKKGGNAMDAAVTTALCIGIHNPFASGTGGGAFILMHLKDGTSSVIDAREVAPRRATQDMFQGNERHMAPLCSLEMSCRPRSPQFSFGRVVDCCPVGDVGSRNAVETTRVLDMEGIDRSRHSSRQGRVSSKPSAGALSAGRLFTRQRHHCALSQDQDPNSEDCCR